MPAVCQFYLQGRCSFGNRCRNLHSNSTSQTTSQNVSAPQTSGIDDPATYLTKFWDQLVWKGSPLWYKDEPEPTFQGLNMTMEEVRWEFYQRPPQEWPQLQQLLDNKLETARADWLRTHGGGNSIPAVGLPNPSPFGQPSSTSPFGQPSAQPTSFFGQPQQSTPFGQAFTPQQPSLFGPSQPNVAIPSQSPFTPAPTQSPFTPAPTQSPFTPAPTQSPFTPAPTQSPFTPAPTQSPFTPAPTQSPFSSAPSPFGQPSQASPFGTSPFGAGTTTQQPNLLFGRNLAADVGLPPANLMQTNSSLIPTSHVGSNSEPYQQLMGQAQELKSRYSKELEEFDQWEIAAFLSPAFVDGKVPTKDPPQLPEFC